MQIWAKRIRKFFLAYAVVGCFLFTNAAEASNEDAIRPPQGVAPLFYIMHDSPYTPPTGAGALGGWFWVTWRHIESQKDVYDWTLIENHLRSEAGKSTRLKNGQVIRKPIALSIVILPGVRQNGVPDYIYRDITGSNDRNVWVSQFPAYPKLNGQICTADTCGGCECDCSPDLRPPWENPYFQERFRKLIMAFGAKYNNDPRVNSIWIATGLYGETVTTGLGGCSYGVAGGCTYQNACRFDYSPYNVFGNWLIQKDVLGTYRQAFPTKPIFIINTAPTSRLELTVRALQISPPAGIKHNGLEFDLPGQNTSPNDQWRSIEYYWQECESKGLEGMVGFEHFYAAGVPHTYWALLAGLSRGMTLIDLPAEHLNVVAQMQSQFETAEITRDNSGDYFPMWSFVEQHFARRASNTPSVWIVLRDTAYSSGEPGDWEFYLYRPENLDGQKVKQDRAQGKTVSVSMGTLPSAAKAQFISRNGAAYVRRTDQATGNRYMYFRIDERWPALQTTGFDIEITYLDSGLDTLSLKYGPRSTDEVIIYKRNTGKFVREKISLPGLTFSTAINEYGDNLRIDCRNDGDEYIHMVRIIPKNWQAPRWQFDDQDMVAPSPPTGLEIY